MLKGKNVVNVDPLDRPPLTKTPAVRTAVLLFGVAALISIIFAPFGVEVRVLVRDPAATYEYPSYVGLFSHIGILMLSGTAAVTGFAVLVRKRQGLPANPVLLGTAFLSTLLVVDDVFMLHEGMTELGETLTFAAFGLIGAWIFFNLKKTNRDYDARGFWVAICCLGGSVLTDILKVGGPFDYWLEDFLKLAGFGAWFTFWIGYSAFVLGSPGEQLDNQPAKSL